MIPALRHFQRLHITPAAPIHRPVLQAPRHAMAVRFPNPARATCKDEGISRRPVSWLPAGTAAPPPKLGVLAASRVRGGPPRLTYPRPQQEGSNKLLHPITFATFAHRHRSGGM